MSLLSKYYYKKYMRKTLTDRMNGTEEVTNVIKEKHHLSFTSTFSNETYESATYGFFAMAGNVHTEKEKV